MDYGLGPGMNRTADALPEFLLFLQAKRKQPPSRANEGLVKKLLEIFKKQILLGPVWLDRSVTICQQ